MNSRLDLVEAFEARIGHQLPDDYREFLLTGPLPYWTEEDDDNDQDGRKDNPFTDLLHSFFDLGVEGEDDQWRSLDSWYDSRDPGFPDWYLGIGEQFGVSIGLGLSGPYRGRVYSWTWDSIDPGAEELAPSFNAFLQDIREREADWHARPRRR